MLLQQQQCLQESPKPKITDEESLVWCYRNGNSEYINANNYLQILVDLCSCAAKDIDLVKVIRSQIDFVSDQLSKKSYQTLIQTTNDSNHSNTSSTDEEVAKSIETEIENLRKVQNLLRKKFRLLLLLRSELANCRCNCSDKWSSSGNVLTHLKKSEFNCKMWFRHINVMETKMQCNRLSVPFDVIKTVRQLLDSNEFESIPIGLDFNHNNSYDNNNNVLKSSNDLKNEKYLSTEATVDELVANDCAVSYSNDGFTGNEYENENSFTESDKNMQTLRYESLLNVNEENSLTLQTISNNNINQTNIREISGEVRTFQELHPISGTNVGLNYSAHEISLMRSNAVLHQEFDYRPNCNALPINTCNHFSDDLLLLPQMSAIEIDQILNN